MGRAICIARDNPNVTRKILCLKIQKELNVKVDRNDTFGKALALAKKEYLIVQTAFQQGALIRRNAPDMPKPPKGILPKKLDISRRARTMAGDTGVTEGVGGFEVLIQEQTIIGPKGDNVRHALSWVECDGEQWNLSPIILPEHTVSEDDNDERFLFFVTGRIDIRDGAGKSVGSRKPLASGNTKNETLPIASVLLSMSAKQDLAMFIKYWREITGSDARGNLDASVTAAEPFLPASFFEASRSKRSLPMTFRSLRKADLAAHLGAVRATLPANPGDLLWLIDEFLKQEFPEGGDIDLASGSDYCQSVYHKISASCAKARYKHHPHLQTMKSLVSTVESGATERLIATNALSIAFEILREPYSKKTKTLVLKVDGKRKDSSRFVATIGSKTPRDTISLWDEPDLECDVEVLDDLTDGEMDSRKRDREDDDDGDAVEGSKKARQDRMERI
jgi:hypothetical protein